MGATVQINDKTSFVLSDGRLVALEEAAVIEEQATKERQELSRHLGEDEGWQLIPEFIRERDSVLFHTVSEYTLEQISKWIEIKRDNEKDFSKKGVYEKLIFDIKQSLLLERLISGKEPFENPPPLSYKNPWYNLVETGEDICIDVFFSWRNWSHKGDFHDLVRIDGEEWDVLEEREKDKHYIIRWPKDNEQVYHLVRISEDDKDSFLHPRMRKLSDGKDRYSWKLTRMEREVSSDGD